jgi:hypothetical protein
VAVAVLVAAGGLALVAAPAAANNPGEPNITTTNLPTATVGQPYSFQLQVTGGLAPYTFSIDPQGNVNGPLPPGLSMNSQGLITGTPQAQFDIPVQVTTYVRVTDSQPPPNVGIGTGPLYIPFDPAGYTPPPALQITTTAIPDATIGQAYSFTLHASGGTPPYSWSAFNLPQGFTLSPAGVLSGQSYEVQQSEPDISVTDSGARVNDGYEVGSAEQHESETAEFTVSSGFPPLDRTLSEPFAFVNEVVGTPGSPSSVLGLVNEIEGVVEKLLLTKG